MEENIGITPTEEILKRAKAQAKAKLLLGENAFASPQLEETIKPTTFKPVSKRQGISKKEAVKNAMIALVIFAALTASLAYIFGEAMDKNYENREAINKPYIEQQEKVHVQDLVNQEIQNPTTSERSL